MSDTFFNPDLEVAPGGDLVRTMGGLASLPNETFYAPTATLSREYIPLASSFDPTSYGRGGGASPLFFANRRAASNVTPTVSVASSGDSSGEGGEYIPPTLSYQPLGPGQTAIGGPGGGTYTSQPGGGSPSTGSFTRDIEALLNTPGFVDAALAILSGPAGIGSVALGTALGSATGRPQVNTLGGAFRDFLLDRALKTEEERARQTETMEGLNKVQEQLGLDRSGIVVENLPNTTNINTGTMTGGLTGLTNIGATTNNGVTSLTQTGTGDPATTATTETGATTGGLTGLTGDGSTITSKTGSTALTANQTAIDNLYKELLDRPADAEGLAYYTSQLEAGLTPAQVAQNIISGAQANIEADLISQAEVSKYFPTTQTSTPGTSQQQSQFQDLFAPTSGTPTAFDLGGGDAASNLGSLGGLDQQTLNTMESLTQAVQEGRMSQQEALNALAETIGTVTGLSPAQVASLAQEMAPSIMGPMGITPDLADKLGVTQTLSDLFSSFTEAPPMGLDDNLTAEVAAAAAAQADEEAAAAQTATETNTSKEDAVAAAAAEEDAAAGAAAAAAAAAADAQAAADAAASDAGEGEGEGEGAGDAGDGDGGDGDGGAGDGGDGGDGGGGDGGGGDGGGGDGGGGGGGDGGGDGGYYQGGLVAFAQGGLIPLQGGGKIAIGPGGGLDDLIPTSIGGRRAAALSDGEFVIPADVVSMMGDGSSNAGARRLYDLVKQIRQVKTGTKQQARPLPVGDILKRSLR